MSKKDKKLTMEEAEGVAGGTILETLDDGSHLKNWGVDVGDSSCSNVRSAFKKLGVELKDHGGLFHGNEYRIDGKTVTRDEALKFVADKLGKEYNPQ